MNRETIFALSTIFGKSGVAVIRISGIEACKVFSHFKIRKKIKPRIAHLIMLYDSESCPIDQALLLWFPAPHSFTGEEVIELHTHGSKAVINTLLKELAKIFRIAQPGEFSKRAFENNKLDLTQAEGLADLIEAETKMQARQAIRQMSGGLENLYNNWRNKLIEAMAEIEACIDFPDEEIPEDIVESVRNRIAVITREMEGHLQDDKRGEKLRSGFHITIIGAPNAGKSTLFNYFAQQDMAIVSDISGTTRDILEVQIDLDGYPVVISDTAGIRDSLDPIEIEGIIRAKKRAKQSDLKIALFSIDNLHNLDQNTKSLVDQDTICVASKADHLEEVVEIMVEDKKLLPISVYNQKSLDKLINMIKEHILNQMAPSELPVITRERHRQAVLLAAQHLKRYNSECNLVLSAEDLRMAARALGEITGHIKIDDVLDQLFSKFCIGK